MDYKVYYRIGNNIRCLRESFGLSQEELAFEIGIGKSAICQYETGTSVPVRDVLIKIAKYFHVTETDLLQNDYSNFRRMTDAPINEFEYNKDMFEKLLPLVSSESSMDNENFRQAYEFHNQVCNLIGSGATVDSFDETLIDKCIELYKKASDEGVIEANANYLWWICFFGFLTSFCDSRMYGGVERLKQGRIGVKEFFKEGYLTPFDTKDDPNKQENKKEFWEEYAVDFYVNIRKLKLNLLYADLGDYYLAISYIFDIVCNGMSSEQNSAIGSEMLSVFSLMGNKYARLNKNS